MKAMILILAIFAMTLSGCGSALLQTLEGEVGNLDAKTLQWVKENRERVCAKAMIDPFVMTAINEGIAQELIHPNFCGGSK